MSLKKALVEALNHAYEHPWLRIEAQVKLQEKIMKFKKSLKAKDKKPRRRKSDTQSKVGPRSHTMDGNMLAKSRVDLGYESARVEKRNAFDPDFIMPRD